MAKNTATSRWARAWNSRWPLVVGRRSLLVPSLLVVRRWQESRSWSLLGARWQEHLGKRSAKEQIVGRCRSPAGPFIRRSQEPHGQRVCQRRATDKPPDAKAHGFLQLEVEDVQNQERSAIHQNNISANHGVDVTHRRRRQIALHLNRAGLHFFLQARRQRATHH